jgi:hypothetical protein
MDLNTASVPAMAKLVGLTVAYDLMLWRPYLSWDEVTCVPGLDGTRVAALKAAAAAKFVCRLETPTGSRFAKKVCRRKADFERKTQDDQEGLRQKQMTGGLFR